MNINKERAIKKIVDMPKEQVSKVLIFMAGMEAEHAINKIKPDNRINDTLDKPTEANRLNDPQKTAQGLIKKLEGKP